MLSERLDSGVSDLLEPTSGIGDTCLLQDPNEHEPLPSGDRARA